MRVCLMIEGQEGVTWDDWVALADGLRAARARGAVPLRPLPRASCGGRPAPRTTRGRRSPRSPRAPSGSGSARSSRPSPSAIRPSSRAWPSPPTTSRTAAIELGLGAGWYEAEHEAHGFAFPPIRERFDKLEADAEAIVRAWTDDDRAQPKPVQQPHPPIVDRRLGEAARRPPRRPPRAGVQHRLRHARRLPRASRRTRRGVPGGRPRPGDVAALADDRRRHRPHARRGARTRPPALRADVGGQTATSTTGSKQRGRGLADRHRRRAWPPACASSRPSESRG